MKKLLVLLLITTQAWAGLPPTTTQGQGDASPKTKFAFQAPNHQITDLGGVKALLETGYHNVLVNPEFQATGVTGSVVPGWTLGTGVTVAGNALDATVKNDDQQATLKLTLASAVNEVFYQDVTVASGSVSGLAAETSFYIDNSNNVANLQVCPRLNGTTLTGGSNCQAVPLGGSWFSVPASTVGGSGTTSIGVSLYASASTSGSVWVTHAYVGRNRGLSNATPITAYKNDLTWTFDNFTASGTDVWYRQNGGAMEVYGRVIAGATSASTFAIDLPAGYQIDTTQMNANANGFSRGKIWRVSSGVALPGASGGAYPLFFDGSTTTKLFMSVIGGAGGAFVKGASNFYASGDMLAFDFSIPVTNFSASVPIASLANASANWSGYHTVTGGWSTTSASFADTSAGTSIALTQTTAQGISCSTAASSLPGISCTLPKAGMYSVCATVEGSVGSSAVYSARLVDGSAAIIDPGRSIAVVSYGSVQLCGDYNVSSVSSASTFKVQLATTGAVTGNITGAGGASGTAAIQWQVYGKSATGPQPYTTGNVSSTSAGMEHVERASITNGGSCAITSQSGSWLSGISHSGTGTCPVTITATEFSGTETCSCTTSSVNIICYLTSKTTSGFTINTENTSGTAVDSNADVICMGPH